MQFKYTCSPALVGSLPSALTYLIPGSLEESCTQLSCLQQECREALSPAFRLILLNPVINAVCFASSCSDQASPVLPAIHPVFLLPHWLGIA